MLRDKGFAVVMMAFTEYGAKLALEQGAFAVLPSVEREAGVVEALAQKIGMSIVGNREWS
ncbi:MAG TPA: hypothetical protein VNU93_07295 [Verrucomicrobiae bacterium]|nr:hypothetical protein [Verrucomicrobiae bacterium]